MDLARLPVALLGMLIVFAGFVWAACLLMLQNAPPPGSALVVFRIVRRLMIVVGGTLLRDPRRRSQLWALYLPISLLAVIAISLATTALGYTLVFWGISRDTLRTSYVNSLSSLSVLGIGGLPSSLVQATLALTEAFTGPICVALLITYLTAMNNTAADRRTLLRGVAAEVGPAKAGDELLAAAATDDGLAKLTSVWKDWRSEFVWIEDSYQTVEGHLILTSPNLYSLWVNQVLVVLDAAALDLALLQPPDPQAKSCLNAGASTLNEVAAYFTQVRLALSNAPRRADPLPKITRARFDALAASLADADVALAEDRDAAWATFTATRPSYAEPIATLRDLMQ